MEESSIKKMEKISKSIERSAKGKAAKRKGKTGERYFADYMSEKIGLSFMRVPNSGAFCGQSNRDRLKAISKTQGYMQLGDIIPPDDLKYRFVFESKNYADLDYNNVLSNNNSAKLVGWLDEMLYDVESCYISFGSIDVIGFLLVKITRKGNHIIVNEGIINKYFNDDIKRTKTFLKFEHKVSELLSNNGWNDIFYLYDFKEFIDLNHQIIFQTF